MAMAMASHRIKGFRATPIMVWMNRIAEAVLFVF